MNSLVSSRPEVTPGGLVTVAYLKARLDEGQDQLGIFSPLIGDLLQRLPPGTFVAEDVQRALQESHGVGMPEALIGTLLRRFTKAGYISRDAGRYLINPDKPLPTSNVEGEKGNLQAAQERLGDALKKHAAERRLVLDTSGAALELLLKFLEEQQLALLLGTPPDINDAAKIGRRETLVVAEFVHDVAGNDPALRAVLKSILEGLVLYHASFLPDLSSVERNFRNLTVVFDSVLVRQALGYEGQSAQKFVGETIELLRSSGVRCCVFDKSVQEIQRILSLYENRLGTAAGRRSLHSVPMARHFLTQRYSPSDVQEMSALLEREIESAGLQIISTPQRKPEFTYSEEKLAERLANPLAPDPQEPRVLHDVDCVAGVLTMRKGKRTRLIEEARALFVTTANLVIRNTRAWWEEDERESGVPPIVHLRSLANLAWLKRPSFNEDFQLQELVTLCAAAMRPSQKTWTKFLSHLEKLKQNNELSEDRATAIIVSAMSDRLLREAEIDEADDDIDASTLDEVIGRVMADYQLKAEEEVNRVAAEYKQRLTKTKLAGDIRAATAERYAEELSEHIRRRNLHIEGRASVWAARIAGAAFWVLAFTAVIGGVALIFSYPMSQGIYGKVAGAAVAVLGILESIGVLSHLRTIRVRLDSVLRRRFRAWFSGEEV